MTSNIDKLINSLKKLKEINLYHISMYIRRGIISRTQNGYDKNLKPFKKYSEIYKQYKIKKGRQHYPVNLTYRFQMLGAIKIGRINDGYKVYIGNQTEKRKAIAHIRGLKNLPRRNFWGLDKKMKSEIDGMIKRIIKQ